MVSTHTHVCTVCTPSLVNHVHEMIATKRERKKDGEEEHPNATRYRRMMAGEVERKCDALQAVHTACVFVKHTNRRREFRFHLLYSCQSQEWMPLSGILFHFLFLR